MPLASPLRQTILLFGLGLFAFGMSVAFAVYGQDSSGITAIWPVNAAVLAFILRLCPQAGASRAPLIVSFVAMAMASAVVGRPIPVALGSATANIVEIALAAWFMRRIPMPLSRMGDLRQFLLGGILAGPMASTLIAAGVMAFMQGVSSEALVIASGRWLLADAMGMAIVAPFALSLGSVSRGGWARALAVPLMIFGICFVLSWQKQFPVLFMAFPLVVLAVLNDRDRGGALGVGAVAVALCLAAQMGQGPIARAPQFGLDPTVIFQVFLGALVMTAYPLSTALKRLDIYAGAMDRRRAAAEDASAAKSELLGRVGEDLRSPLTGVVTVAEMLRSGRLGELNERQRELLARIAEGGAEIEALTHEMVALADGREALPRTSSAAEAVNAAVAAARFRARRAEVSLEVLTGDPAWRVAMDGDKLQRMVLDGISAALDASPPNGTVRLIVGLEAPQTISIAIDDAAGDSLDERMALMSVGRGAGAASSGFGFDRSELRRSGGDLTFGAGALGGGRLRLVMPRAGDEERVAA